MKYSQIIFISFVVLFFYNCNSYNSNESNKALIQGKWILADVFRENLDSVTVDFDKQKTYLIFKDDFCIEEMPDLSQKTNYNFSIEDYNLNLYTDTILINVLQITKLTEDSLILSRKKDIWKYLKVAE